MCGLVGFSGKTNFDLEKIKVLIVWNSLERGEDSTGLYSPINGLKKSLLKGSDFVVNKGDEIIPDSIFMSHVRFKTIGVVSANNAHPFQRGNWVLEHNGTLKNQWPIANKYKLKWADYNVDSDVLCGAIAECDNFDPIKDIDGPAALIIHNTTRPNRLYVFRNDERPLFRGMIGDNMYISSIENSLKVIGCTNIKEFVKNLLYTIQDGVIIKPPVEYKNKPYYFTNTTVNNNSLSLEEVQQYKGCYVRGDCDINYKPDPFQIKKNKYYYVKDVTSEKYLILNDPMLNDHTIEVKGFYSLFKKEDIIKINSYCKARCDIYRIANKEQILMKREEVGIITNISDDGIVTISNPKTKKIFCTANKSLFIKLTAETEETFKKEMGDESISVMADLFSCVRNQNNTNNIKPIESINNITTNTIDIIENEDVEVLPDEDNYYELLGEHFNEMENEINTLNELMKYEKISPEIRLLVVNILDMNYMARSRFLGEDYTEEVEEEEINAGK